MSYSSSAALAVSRTVLRALIILNIIAAVTFLLILVGSVLGRAAVLAELESWPGAIDTATVLTGLRLVMVIGLLMVPLAHIIMVRLLAMGETVRAGDPFVAENARRLGTIAWALLGVQLLDLAFGAVSLTLFASNKELSWNLTITGWLAVLLLFVLARVFDQGARMRDELEGTV